MSVLNFGNEPGLKSENSACGPSVRSRRRGAFLGITRGLRAAQGEPYQPGSTHGPRGSQGPLGISPGHPRRWFRFGAILPLFSGPREHDVHPRGARMHARAPAACCTQSRPLNLPGFIQHGRRANQPGRGCRRIAALSPRRRVLALHG